MMEPLYCTRCGFEIGDGCSCEECMGPGPYCDVTGQLNCDCQFCQPAAGTEET